MLDLNVDRPQSYIISISVALLLSVLKMYHETGQRAPFQVISALTAHKL